MAKGFSLGRGLDALIDTHGVNADGSSAIHEVELNLIIPNPNQPRTSFNAEALEELSVSIKELGVISPITLRKNDDGTYQIIAGERRYRAAKMAGLERIPAYVKTAADEQVMEMALIENIQREDLNAIEIALAYDKLMKEYKMTQERLSARIGKKRATIANYLRLLHLPAQIQMGITEHKIDMGHARALLSTNDTKLQLALYSKIVNNGWSVRQVESAVKNEKTKGQEKEEVHIKSLEEYKAVENRLKSIFNKARFSCDDNGKGSITLPFANDDELKSIMSLLDKIQA